MLTRKRQGQLEVFKSKPLQACTAISVIKKVLMTGQPHINILNDDDVIYFHVTWPVGGEGGEFVKNDESCC